jgi:hypothetical protein
MRRPVKVTVWITVLAACAGAGAFVAAHTDPFPPGVEDPGAVSGTPSPSVSPEPPMVLRLTVTAATRHELHVGGACSSDWRVAVRIRVREDASVANVGPARLVGEATCPFPTAQVQARAALLALEGHVEEGTLLAALHETGERRPAGSGDLGGFFETLPRLRLHVPIEGPAEAQTVERPDGDLGRYVGRYRATLVCVTGCK